MLFTANFSPFPHFDLPKIYRLFLLSLVLMVYRVNTNDHRDTLVTIETYCEIFLC